MRLLRELMGGQVIALLMGYGGGGMGVGGEAVELGGATSVLFGHDVLLGVLCEASCGPPQSVS